MKLSDILNLKTLRYSDDIEKKHLNKINSEPSMLAGFETSYFTGNPPPSNDSSVTKLELEELSKLKTDNAFVKEMDNVDGVFKEYCNWFLLFEKNTEFPSDTNLIESLLTDSSIVVMKLKYHYNRPRPNQLANHPLIKMNIGNSHIMDSMKTPSYPSGHSTQGILIGKVLSDMYPSHEYNLMSLGRDISKSRNIARAHYPSDSSFGMKLGYAMFNYLKKTNRL